MAAQDDIREKLSQFVGHLRALEKRERDLQKKNPRIPSSIPFDLTDFVASAIESYLKKPGEEGSRETLDAAFGVNREPGRPPTDLTRGKHFELAEKLVWLRMTAKDDDIPLSWAQIDSRLTEAGDVDGSNTAKLSNIHRRYKGVVVEDIVAQVLSALNALNDDDV